MLLCDIPNVGGPSVVRSERDAVGAGLVPVRLTGDYKGRPDKSDEIAARTGSYSGTLERWNSGALEPSRIPSTPSARARSEGLVALFTASRAACSAIRSCPIRE